MMPLPEWVYDMLDGFIPQPDPDDDWTEVEVFPMLAYTQDSIRLNEEQYAEYSAWRKQMDYLKRRYGTYRPASIADYWIRGTA